MATTTSEFTALHGLYRWPDTLKGVYYGPGCVTTALPNLLETLQGRRALIVTGKSLNEKTDVIRRIEGILKDRQAYGSTFTGIGEHSPIAGIRQGVDAFLEHDCDIIVAVGGGSPIDASKAILYHIQQKRGGPTPKQIAIPTTLSAAEYTSGAGFTNEEGHKTSVASPELTPSGIILDAELTLPTPERLWFCTGIRALDHAVENLYRPGVPEPIKGFSYLALADLFKYLPLSKQNPGDVNVRQKLQIAAWLSLWPVVANRLGGPGLSHFLGHKLGATYKIPHGITSCLTLASVVALKSEIASKEDKEALSEALWYLHIPPTDSLDENVRKLSDEIQKLVSYLALNSTLAEYGVPKEDLPKIAALTVGSDDPQYPKVLEMLQRL